MNTQKINVLIVDDEEQFLRSLAKILRIRGFHVMAANRGDTAVETARKHAVDIALIDVKMPGMDGMELLGHLKSQHPSVEVILLTGHGSYSPHGAYTCLQKPCDIDLILQTVIDAYWKKEVAGD